MFADLQPYPRLQLLEFQAVRCHVLGLVTSFAGLRLSWPQHISNSLPRYYVPVNSTLAFDSCEASFIFP